MPITLFDHYTLRSKDIETTAAFYADVMGFRIQPLDAFEFPMRLCFLGDQALVHLLGAGPALDAFLARSAPSLKPNRARDSSNLEHVAFNATGLKDFIARLEKGGVPYLARDLVDYGVSQLLFDDPDGVEIEVNFPLAEKNG